MDINYQTPSKDCENKLNKNQCREGDWICLNCSNLNFSFRKKCNRCKTQTRKQNQDLQNVYEYYYYNQNNIPNDYFYQLQTDNPHTYIQSQVQDNNHNIYSNYLQDHNNIHENNLISSQEQINFTQFERQYVQMNTPIKSSFIQDQEQQKVDSQQIVTTNSKKLLTPSNKKKSNKIKNNDLPSVSPLLKKLLQKQNTMPCSKSKKDALNVSLFYDQVWNNNNKQNNYYTAHKINFSSQSLNNPSDLKLISHSKQDNKNNLFKQNAFISNSTVLQQNKSYKINNDKFELATHQQYFPYLNSPDIDEHSNTEFIQIDEGDQQLAQIIRKIII